MDTIAKIRAEIERLMSGYKPIVGGVDELTGANIVLAKLLSFLDTLPDESEQPTMGYDEAYLNEKIAKASKSWKGVDVDKFMDEVRGREPVSDCHDLEEAAEEYNKQVTEETKCHHNALTYAEGYEDALLLIPDAFKAGAEWQRRQMMDEAYEEEVQEVYRDDDGIHCCVSVGTDYKPGTIVYVITIPKEGAE